MAMRSGFYDSDIIGYDNEGLPIFDRAENAEFFARFFASFVGNGVFPNPADSFKVLAGEGMTLTVQKGACFIEGHYAFDLDSTAIVLEPSDPTMNRIDRVVLRLDLQSRDITVAVKKGTPSASPTAPALKRPVTGSADVYELGIADIRVLKNVPAITQDKITDTRLSGDLCGVVTGAIKSVDTTQLFNQYQAYLDANIALWESRKVQQQADWQAQMDYQKGRSDTQNSEIQAWYDSVRTDITKLQAFHFDNLAELGGCTRTTVKNGNSFRETIVKTYSGDKVAERITTKNSTTQYTETINVYAEDGVTLLKSSVIETTKQGSGQYQEKIISNSVGGMPQYYTVSPYMGIRIIED